MRKSLFLALIILSLPFILSAQRVKASVNKFTLTLSDILEYTIEISSEGKIQISEPPAPSFNGFRYNGIRSSQTHSTSIVNGKIQNLHSYSFYYRYIPLAEGKYQLPSQSIKVANRSFATPAFEITVIKGANPPPKADRQEDYYSPWGGNRLEGSTYFGVESERNRAYIGQPVIVSYYLYTDQMVRSFNLEDERDFGGYGKSIYEQPQSLDYQVVSVQGSRFQRALIKRIAIIPNQAGRLQLPQLRGTARVYNFGYLSKEIVSSDKYLEVIALPSTGTPKNFLGAVGSFQVSEELNSKEISLGEAISYQLKISGKGNFNHFANPQFAGSSAQISSPVAMEKLNAGIEGYRKLYYTIIPTEKGSFEIPRLEFSWFDPALGAYQSFRSKPQTIKVKSANVMSYHGGLWKGGAPRTLNPMRLRPQYPPQPNYLKSWWYWVLAIAILIILGLAIYRAHTERERLLNPAKYLSKRAGGNLKRYLQDAEQAAQEQSMDFYLLAERGFQDFLSEKYGIARGLSNAEKVELLAEKGIPQDLCQKTAIFLERCALGRYSPEALEADIIQQDLVNLRLLTSAFAKLAGGIS